MTPATIPARQLRRLIEAVLDESEWPWNGHVSLLLDALIALEDCP